MRSFARIHEANLKKQGVLALTFKDPDDYDKVRVDDTVDVIGLADARAGNARHGGPAPLRRVERRASRRRTRCRDEHIAWFQAGSALNVLRSS